MGNTKRRCFSAGRVVTATAMITTSSLIWYSLLPKTLRELGNSAARVWVIDSTVFLGTGLLQGGEGGGRDHLLLPIHDIRFQMERHRT